MIKLMKKIKINTSQEEDTFIAEMYINLGVKTFGYYFTESLNEPTTS